MLKLSIDSRCDRANVQSLVLHLLQEEAEGEEELRNAIARVLQEEEIDRSNLRRILRQVGKCGKYLLLLLDDYDTIAQ